jgi:pimeloyl-ACP methyl ester carboxylesterase
MLRAAAAGAAAAVPLAAGAVLRRGVDRLLDAPRTAPDEAALGPTLDALGGEVVRLRSRDGLKLGARWLPAEPDPIEAAGRGGWRPDPYEAILLLHGWSGSVAPDVVEFGPFLRRTANVLGLDFRGHGESDDSPTTFGLREVEDVAGALAWLGERGIRRVAMFGTSMGGVTALASVAVLGDGSLPSADLDPDSPADVAPRRPRIVGVVAESVAPELPVVVGNRMAMPGVMGRALAAQLFAAGGRRLGADMRATEPIRVVALVAPVPLLLVHGEADPSIPLRDAERLAAAAGPTAEHWVAPRGEHSRSHAADPAAYEARVGAFLRAAFAGSRDGAAILAASQSTETADAHTGRLVND